VLSYCRTAHRYRYPPPAVFLPGAKIFDTDEDRKRQRFLDSCGKTQHDSVGLEEVLKSIFGDL
jgi:hypothetical protein